MGKNAIKEMCGNVEMSKLSIDFPRLFGSNSIVRVITTGNSRWFLKLHASLPIQKDQKNYIFHTKGKPLRRIASDIKMQAFFLFLGIIL